MRYLTAGESHGQAMAVIIEGFPANVPVDKEKIAEVLRRRREAPGRGPRMQLETEEFQILSGMQGGKTLGSPVAVLVPNAEWAKWAKEMDPWSGRGTLPVTVPRPGHADLPGAVKYRQKDLRLIAERASARETVVRTLAGCFCLQLLEQLDVAVSGRVVSIGGCADWDCVLQESARLGDTVGGIIQVEVRGLPGGIGSHVHWDRRLDARLAGAVTGIQSIKGVEFGRAFELAGLRGSEYHDAFAVTDGKIVRTSNNAGGIEGGMSNGEPIILRAAVKPVPTLDRSLMSIDLTSGAPCPAPVSRHDVSAVGAAVVVAEAVCAWELAACIVEQFGGDTLEDLAREFAGYRRRWEGEISWLGE